MHRVVCMHSDTAAGGVADVHWGEAASALPAHADCVQVCVNPVDDELSAESYTPEGSRIRFCGHGSLAAAWVAFTEHAPNSNSLRFFSAHHGWQARRAGDDITLIYQRPQFSQCRVPQFAEAAMGAQPLAAAEVGDESGYLLLQFADPDTIRSLQPDTATIIASTGRALIATACISAADFVFRYFAPQYGTPEDAATGSAAVQLAAYWGARLPADTFQVQQLSHHGAEMRVTCGADTVALTARVAYR